MFKLLIDHYAKVKGFSEESFYTFKIKVIYTFAPVVQRLECVLGKDEVPSSILGWGFPVFQKGLYKV